MDTNINTIDSSYTSDVVTYDDSQIDTVINEFLVVSDNIISGGKDGIVIVADS